jgi:hypothetical protein
MTHQRQYGAAIEHQPVVKVAAKQTAMRAPTGKFQLIQHGSKRGELAALASHCRRSVRGGRLKGGSRANRRRPPGIGFAV